MCYDTFHLTPKYPLMTPDSFAHFAAIFSRNLQISSDEQRQERLYCPYTFKCNRFCNRRRRGSSSSDREHRVSQAEKHVFLRRPRNTRAEGFPHKYPLYNSSSDRHATGHTGSARYATHQGSSTNGTTFNGAQDACTRILFLPEYRSRSE